MIRISHVRSKNEFKALESLDSKIFNEDDPCEKDGGLWWLAYDDRVPVGFGGMRVIDKGRGAFFCRAGVLRRARGKGVHCRLIRARLACAARMGWEYALTYTAKENTTSANNLIRSGFLMYVPSYWWGLRDGNYWFKMLKP